ncbi:hypothetical protein [Halobacterium sp. KA-4]|uniref:hypothetical protein n=1 Tax=Halobacterium sp. KA-4 TaxID=2896367 RepID=UPI001E408396|nr:hypothetical protein [Halobacterium sp. KA-4]
MAKEKQVMDFDPTAKEESSLSGVEDERSTAFCEDDVDKCWQKLTREAVSMAAGIQPLTNTTGALTDAVG